MQTNAHAHAQRPRTLRIPAGTDEARSKVEFLLSRLCELNAFRGFGFFTAETFHPRGGRYVLLTLYSDRDFATAREELRGLGLSAREVSPKSARMSERRNAYYEETDLDNFREACGFDPFERGFSL